MPVIVVVVAVAVAEVLVVAVVVVVVFVAVVVEGGSTICNRGTSGSRSCSVLVVVADVE